MGSVRLSSRILRSATQQRIAQPRLHSTTTPITPADPSAAGQSVDVEDVRRHARLAEDWWTPNGPMRALHSMNRIRVPFIRDGLIGTGRVCPDLCRTSKSLSGLQVLEVGCGAGLLTEALARIHAQMTSIDPGSEVIEVACRHLQQQFCDEQFIGRINYRNESIEEHLQVDGHCGKYDAVVVSEVIEHVVEKAAFLQSCVASLKPGGSIFITTFNKTCLSYLGSIVVAENLIGLVPQGTHDWERYITPIETERILNALNCSTVLLNGFLYEFWRDEWKWIDSLDMSYALHAVKLE